MIEKDEIAVLYWKGGKSLPFKIADSVSIKGLGAFHLKEVMGKPWGASVTVGEETFHVVKASFRDLADNIV
ncbi:MAG TPA: hypothetical protein ENN76_02350, partial [Euryarchaeota archaeon]|nr:hypothetical protein [Euryarchaeota archaeon]